MHDSIHSHYYRPVCVCARVSFAVLRFRFKPLLCCLLCIYFTSNVFYVWAFERKKNRIWVLSRVSKLMHLVERKRNNVVICLIFYFDFFFFNFCFSHFPLRYSLYLSLGLCFFMVCISKLSCPRTHTPNDSIRCQFPFCCAFMQRPKKYVQTHI